MKPIKKIRLSDQIIEAIKEMISEGDFSTGDKFYSENELTKKLDVSRSSIREAIRILEATGYVSVTHGKGIFVANSTQKELNAFQNWLKNNKSTILDHFEVRLIIDSKAAAYAAEKADKADLVKMEEICCEFESILNADDNRALLINCDERFHLSLAKSTKNRTLYFIMKTLTKSLPEGWISSLHVPGRAEKTNHEHKLIVEAIKKRDARKAEETMLEHLHNAICDIKESIKDNI